MKTDVGLLELKYRLLFHFWGLRKTHLPHVMNLYFQLIQETSSNTHTNQSTDKTHATKTPEQVQLLQTIQDKLDDTEYKLYMMKKLSHLLPPLNIHEPRVKRLDDWQIEAVNYIKKGDSVMVEAPTSSGKSFVGLSAGIIHKKVLYVCPAKPIAYQVGAHFNMMGYKVHYLLDNLCHEGYDNKTTIFVGVPSVIEDNLWKLGTTFDYAVFDEIHNLNKEDDGHIYENIIKLVRCPFIALSATIGNVNFLMDIFTKIHKDELSNAREDKRKQATLQSGTPYMLNTHIRSITYTKRFINQQKMIYEHGTLQNLHPLACIHIEDLTDDFIRQNLQFTPYDSAVLWETMEEVFDNDSYSDEFDAMIESCSPDNYFEDDHQILTLDDTRDYETFIKGILVKVASTHPKEITQILSTFHRVPDEPADESTIGETKDIIQMFTQCKEQDCLPMLVFNTDTVRCKTLFTELFQEIDTCELDEYPYHYDILEYKDELYTTYRDKREQFIDNMKIGKTNDAQTEKQTKVERFDRHAERQYRDDVINYYHTCIHNVERRDSREDLKACQVKHLKREMKYYQKYPSFCGIDVFQKHKAFCFTNSDPMTGDQIRSIRREIKRTLGIKISYEHELFQMLKRGIGIYTEDMPEEYKWILQKLMDDKKIGIVISDRTLCLGIDLPIRSSLLLGLPGSQQFTVDDYLQMSGRAGRRGKDDRGNTIFYNVDYTSLMKGILPTIGGSSVGIPGNYQAFNQNIDAVYQHSMNPHKLSTDPVYSETSNPKLQWLLRYQQNVPEFIHTLDRWNKDVYQVVSDIDKELCVLGNMLSLGDLDSGLLDVYKKKVITTEFQQCQCMCRMLETVYNTLKDKKYTHLKDVMRRVHSTYKGMVLKYQGF
jgi:superfamily II DNA or RNA helicase